MKDNAQGCTFRKRESTACMKTSKFGYELGRYRLLGIVPITGASGLLDKVFLAYAANRAYPI